MSSAWVWIVFPLVAGLIGLVILKYRRVSFYSAAVIALGLTILAWALPVGEVLSLGSMSIKLSETLTFLGRKLILDSNDQLTLVLLFGITSFWLLGGLISKAPTLLAPTGLLFTSLLVASLAVEPFLYAAIFIECAVLVSIPLFTAGSPRIHSGVIRYLVFQTIGMPLMLITGWILSGMEALPSDPALVIRAVVFLGLGFSFILAIFPLYTWIPMLVEEEDPYLSGFILLLLPTSIMLFLLSFIDRYPWLRSTINLQQIIQYAGILMIVTGGIWCAFQRNLARMFGYAVIVENGFSLLAIGLMTAHGYHLFASLFLSRIVSYGLWSLSLSVIKADTAALDVANIRGYFKKQALPVLALLLAQFSIGGLPLLAGFPLRAAMIEELSLQSVNLSWVIILGIAGLWGAGIHSMYIFLQGDGPNARFFHPKPVINVLLLLGILAILWMGFFPHVYAPLMEKLLLPFTRLLAGQ